MTESAQSQTISIRIDAELYKLIKAEAEKNRATIVETVKDRLAFCYEVAGEPIQRGGIYAERERKAKTENTIKEIELARLIGSVITKEDAAIVVEKDLGLVRQTMLGVARELPNAPFEMQKEFLETYVNDCFRVLSGLQPETYERIAKQYAASKGGA